MLTYIAITGTFNYRTTPTKTPAAGEVIEFVPRTAARPDGSEVLLPKTLSTTLNVSGQIPAGFSLPTLPGGVYYTVRETFEGGRGKYTILVNPGDPTTDLCDVAPVVPPPLLVSTRGPVGPPGPQPPLSNQVPAALGTAAPGTGTKAAREDHIHTMPTAAQVGADTAGAATGAVIAHEAAADPHPQYTTAAEAAAAAPVQTVAGRSGNVTLATADVAGAVDTSDARLSDARTPTAHTHPLSDLTQSGATMNQVPQWNGTAWVPATVSGGGGSGDVVGPASSTNSHIALFDGITGKLLKDGGVSTADFATAAQGALAGSALQPADGLAALDSAAASKLSGIAPGATVGADWNTNVVNKPTLGTAAAANTGDFAAAAQGAKADSALQPITVGTPSSSSGTLTLDFASKSRAVFATTLTENVTTVTISNLPSSVYLEYEIHYKQDGTGSYTVAQPASHKALGGSDTTVASAANAVTVLSASSVDGGTTWRYAMQESA